MSLARTHAVADKSEARVARALDGAFQRMRERLDQGRLVAALERGDSRAALAVIAETDFEDALEPAVEILKDAMKRGGKAGAEDLGEEA